MAELKRQGEDLLNKAGVKVGRISGDDLYDAGNKKLAQCREVKVVEVVQPDYPRKVLCFLRDDKVFGADGRELGRVNDLYRLVDDSYSIRPGILAAIRCFFAK